MVKCYVHEQKDAVGLCVTCGRAMCKQCAVTVGGRLRCDSCYIESQLGPETPAQLTEVRTTPSVKAAPKPMLLSFGALGSLVGVLIPILYYVSYNQSGGSVSLRAASIAIVVLLTGLWFGVQAIGFLGIYRNYSEIMGLVAFVFGLLTAASHGVYGTLVLMYGLYYAYSSVIYSVPLIYQVVTTAIQATAFLLIRQLTGNEKLFVAAAIVLIAAGSASWFSSAVPILSVSNAFLTISFLKIRMPSEHEQKSKPEEPVVDALKELQ